MPTHDHLRASRSDRGSAPDARATAPARKAIAMTMTPTTAPRLPWSLLCASLPLLAILLLPAALEAGDQALSFPGEKLDQWNGFTRHTFSCDGCTAWVAEPKAALPGKPWSWCMEFPDAFTQRCAAPALLEKGFHHVHIAVGNTFGCPAAVAHFDAFYATLIAKGLARRAALIGISRGGLYAYRWAAGDPAAGQR